MIIYLGPTEHIDQPECLTGKLRLIAERQKCRQQLAQEHEPHRRRLDEAARRSALMTRSCF